MQVGPQPVKVVDVADPEGVVYNRSTTTTVFWGPTASQANRADASILDPNATLAVNDAAQVWMSTGANGPTITVDYHPNSVAFFRGVTSGQGSLVIPSIFSPNFSAINNTGWSINNDGSVVFNNGTFRGTITGSQLIIKNSFGATILIIDPTHDGTFVYADTGSATQGALIGSWAGKSGNDPVNGTAYPQGFNTTLGTISGSTITASVFQSTSLSPGVKIDASGNIIVFNSFGAIVLYVAPAKDGVFIYADTGSATQGAMIASIAGTTGTDPVNGARYINGVTAYVVIGNVTYTSSLNQTTSIVGGAGVAINDANNPGFAAGGIFGEVSGGTTKQATATLTSGQATNVDAFAAVTASSSVQSGVPGGLVKSVAAIHQLAGALEIDGPSVAQGNMQSFNAMQTFPDNTHVVPARVSYGANGDGNTYAYGKLEVDSATAQTINTTQASGGQFTNLTFNNLLAGVKYKVRVFATYTGNQAAGAAQFFWFTNGAVAHVDGYDYFIQGSPANLGVYFGAFPTVSTGPTLSTGHNIYYAEFQISMTTSGNLRLKAGCNLAPTDTFVINNVYGYLEPL